jgi:hypothetical protein
MNPTRRKMITGTGLAGAFVAGFFAPKVVVEVKEKLRETRVEDIRHLAPQSSTTLTLQGNPKPVVPSPYNGNGFYVSSNPEYQNKVEMSVGKDNRLWLKIDGEWRRVAIDPSWCDPTYCDPAEV